MKLLVCNDCRVFSEPPADGGAGAHAGHRGFVVEGDDYDQLVELVGRHLARLPDWLVT